MTYWRIGCCGFAKGREAYYERLSVVEIQQTFYKLPPTDRASAWRLHAPKDFEFVLKAPQLITHRPSSPTYRRLGEQIPASKAHFYGSFQSTSQVAKARKQIETMALELKSQVLLYQCPPSFTPTPENEKNLRRFFGKTHSVQRALELRGRDWTLDRIQGICSELGVIPVVDPLVQKPLMGKTIAYFRLHGLPALRYSYAYSPADLRRLHDRVRDLPVKKCYVLFNNFTMFADALKFQKLTDNS